MISEKSRIDQYIAESNPYIISINYLPETIKADCIFITNSKRYNQQMTAISEKEGTVKLIATSNLTRTHSKFDYTLDYESLIDRDAVFMDNSFIMLLKVLIKADVKTVALAGFDGYVSDGGSYFSSQMEYDFVKRLGKEINEYVNKTLPKIRELLEINFITSTIYKG